MTKEKNKAQKNRELFQAFENMEEQLQDLQNIVQLLEMSLTGNNDDEHILRSMRIIDKMLSALLKSSLPSLRIICFDPENIEQ